MNGKNIPKNLVALIKIFQEMPELFAKKLLEHQVFKNDFLAVLSENPKLSDLAENPMKYQQGKRFFYSIDDINKFYNQFFQLLDYDQKHKHFEDNVYNATSETEALIIQLENALEDENYILASKIDRYMKLLNIDYTPKI